MGAARLLLVVIAVTSVTRAVWASEQIWVGIAAEASQVAAFEASLRARLRASTLQIERLEAVDVEAALAEPPRDVLARGWITLSAEGVTLVLLTGNGARGMVRRLAREGASDEVLREEVALVVGAAVDTIRADDRSLSSRAVVRRQLGLAVEGPPPVAPEPVPGPLQDASGPPPAPAPAPVIASPSEPPPPPETDSAPAWRLAGTVYYEAQGYAGEQLLLHGPGLGLGLGGPELTLGPRFELTGQYRFVAEAQSEVAGLRLHSGAFRLVTQLTALRAGPVRLRGVAGMGLDLLVIEPFLVDDGATLLPSRTRAAPLVRFGIDVGVRLAGELSLRGTLGMDVDVIGTRFVVQDGAELVPLLDPLRVRPLLSLGLDTTLAGQPLFSEAP